MRACNLLLPQPSVDLLDRLDPQHIASLVKLNEMVGAESDVFTVVSPMDCDDTVFNIDLAVASLPYNCQCVDVVAIHIVIWQLMDLARAAPRLWST